MDKPRFTPGPWRAEQPWSGFTTIYGPDGKLIFGIAAGDPREKRSDAECDANLRLMLAAPALYEALLDASGHLNFIGYGDNYERDAADIAGLPDAIQAALDAAVPPQAVECDRIAGRLVTPTRRRCEPCGRNFRDERSLCQHERDKHGVVHGKAAYQLSLED